MNKNNKGNGAAPQTAPTAAGNSVDIAGQTFRFKGFELPTGTTDYDDPKTGKRTKTLANVLVQIGDSPFYLVGAAVKFIEDTKRGTKGHTLAFPTMKMGRQQTIQTESDTAKASLAAWKDQILRTNFPAWWKDHKGDATSAVATSNGGLVDLDLD